MWKREFSTTCLTVCDFGVYFEFYGMACTATVQYSTIIVYVSSGTIGVKYNHACGITQCIGFWVDIAVRCKESEYLHNKYCVC